MTQRKLELFNQAVAQVLLHEGGYTHDKDDPGGETNFGISTRFLRQNNITANVKFLKKEEAIFLYKKFFWDKYHFELLKQAPIATKIFDTAVNIGPAKAIELAQRVLGLSDDGIIGPKTASALNGVKPQEFLQAYRLLQKEYYAKIIKKNPKLIVFKKGWNRRAES